MERKTITAVFKGSDENRDGYRNNKQYTLHLTHNRGDVIRISRTEGGGVCFYHTILDFLDNWYDIIEL
jgi:hypothetical protein